MQRFTQHNKHAMECALRGGRVDLPECIRYTDEDHNNMIRLERLGNRMLSTLGVEAFDQGQGLPRHVVNLMNPPMNVDGLGRVSGFAVVQFRLLFALGHCDPETRTSRRQWSPEYTEFIRGPYHKVMRGTMDINEFCELCYEKFFSKLWDEERARACQTYMPSLIWPLLFHCCDGMGKDAMRFSCMRYLQGRAKRRVVSFKEAGNPSTLGDLAQLPELALLHVLKLLPVAALPVVACINKTFHEMVYTVLRTVPRKPDVLEHWNYCQLSASLCVWNQQPLIPTSRLVIVNNWVENLNINTHMDRLDFFGLPLEIEQFSCSRSLDMLPTRKRKASTQGRRVLPPSVTQASASFEAKFDTRSEGDTLYLVERMSGPEFRALMNAVLERDDRPQEDNLRDIQRLIHQRGDRKAGGAFLTEQCADTSPDALNIIRFFFEQVEDRAYHTVYQSYIQAAVGADNATTLHYLLLKGGKISSLYDMCIQKVAINCIKLLNNGGPNLRKLLDYHTAFVSRHPRNATLKTLLALPPHITPLSCLGPLP